MISEGAPARSQAYRAYHYVMMAVVAGAVITSAVAIGIGVRKHFQADPRESQVRLIADGSAVSGGSSTLTRSGEKADFTFHTSGLPNGHVVTLRAMIFNHPEKCSHGTRNLRCGEADLDDPAVEASVVLAGSAWLRSGTTAKFAGTLSADTQGKILTGPGLTNAAGADVDFVLLDHGPPVQGRFSEMLQTFRGGCTQPQGSETAGPNACADIQFSPHETR